MIFADLDRASDDRTSDRALREVRVFEFLVGREASRQPVDEGLVARGTGLHVADVRAALAALESDHLVVRLDDRTDGARGAVWAALPPRSALTPFLEQRRQELAAWERQVDALERMYRDTVEQSGGAVLVDVLTGAEQVGAVYRALLEGATEELLHLARPPYLPVTPNLLGEVDEPVVAPSVEMRSVYEAASLTEPGSLATVRGARRTGAQLRLTQQVPLKLVVADRKVAMLPARGDDAGGATLVVHAPALVGALVELFEHVWDAAVPQSLWASRDGGDPADGVDAAAPAGPVVLDERTRAILDLMAGGLTDEAIARALGVSRRTVQADVSALAATLGARTRFQVALLAAERGLVGAPEATRAPD